MELSSAPPALHAALPSVLPSACPSPPAGVAVRAVLSDPDTLERLAAFVGRAVPAGEVGDVLHLVVAEALHAAAAPAEPAEARRWLFGVARHKVADFHRSRRRPLGVQDPEQLAAPPAPLEARSLLRQVLADAARDPRAAQTMAWMAREAEGEPLEALAREAALPAATVRQRVSRLRRWLRQRWGSEALLVAALSLVGVAMLRGSHAPRPVLPAPISADAAGDETALGRAVLQGRWHVEAVSPGAAVSGAAPAVVEAEALATTLDVSADRLLVRTPARTVEASLQPGPVTGGVFPLRIVETGGRVRLADVRTDGPDRLVVSSAGSEVTLRRD